MRAAVAILVMALGCTSVATEPDGTKTVRTFGAVTTRVTPDGVVETSSQGLSEGFVGFLMEIPGAVLRLVAGAAGGLGAPPAARGGERCSSS